jgi:hypothetical protein
MKVSSGLNAVIALRYGLRGYSLCSFSNVFLDIRYLLNY